MTPSAYPPVTLESADDRQKPILEGISKAMGFVPNLMASMGNSPALLRGYLALSEQYDKASLNPIERQLVLLAVSQANDCPYCRAAHSPILRMHRADAALIEAVKTGGIPEDPKLAALVAYARALAEKRGHTEEELGAFVAAGYTPEQGLEVIMGVGLKTMSNYFDHLAHVELDGPFQAEA